MRSNGAIAEKLLKKFPASTWYSNWKIRTSMRGVSSWLTSIAQMPRFSCAITIWSTTHAFLESAQVELDRKLKWPHPSFSIRQRPASRIWSQLTSLTSSLWRQGNTRTCRPSSIAISTSVTAISYSSNVGKNLMQPNLNASFSKSTETCWKKSSTWPCSKACSLSLTLTLYEPIDRYTLTFSYLTIRRSTSYWTQCCLRRNLYQSVKEWPIIPSRLLW